MLWSADSATLVSLTLHRTHILGWGVDGVRGPRDRPQRPAVPPPSQHTQPWLPAHPWVTACTQTCPMTQNTPTLPFLRAPEEGVKPLEAAPATWDRAF